MEDETKCANGSGVPRKLRMEYSVANRIGFQWKAANTIKRREMDDDMTDKTYTVRPMSREDLDMAVEWAAEEGWNPGLHDADCYYVADPNGFFMGWLGDEPIAAISAIKYGDSFGFCGFYIVKPEYRGQVYSIQLIKGSMRHLGGVNIGLDGVVEQQENYKKIGFRMAYRNIRYEGFGGGKAPDHPDVVPLSRLPFEAIESYEKPFFPANRSRFLKAWINQPDSHALGILQNGRLAGYGVLRKCRKGYKIGPLHADHPELATTLFLTFKSKIGPSEPFYLDVPEPNPDAVELAERYRMKPSFETARMYTKKAPDLPLNRVYGITSFEIG